MFKKTNLSAQYKSKYLIISLINLVLDLSTLVSLILGIIFGSKIRYVKPEEPFKKTNALTLYFGLIKEMIIVGSVGVAFIFINLIMNILTNYGLKRKIGCSSNIKSVLLFTKFVPLIPLGICLLYLNTSKMDLSEGSQEKKFITNICLIVSTCLIPVTGLINYILRRINRKSRLSHRKTKYKKNSLIPLI